MDSTHFPIPLAFVITELEVGGAERCLVQLATALDQRRFAPAVYSLAPPPAGAQGRLVQELQGAGIPVEFIGATSPWQAWSASRRLARRFATRQPALVQTFLFHANVLGTCAARRAGVRCVVAGIRVADPGRWRQALERQAARHWQRAVCVSESVARYARDRVKIPAGKVCVIPNAIDPGRYPDPAGPLPPGDLGVAAGRRIIVAVGRLHPQKGFDWLLRLAPHFLAALPDVDLIIVGRGPARASLERLADQLQLAPRVRFLGWRADVPRILAAAQLLVLPSRWEGMPNVILEAMATGLPVVATRVEGVNELLGQEETSQIVDFGDARGFCERIGALLQNGGPGPAAGKRNRERVMRHFTVQRMVDQYQDLYESLLREC